MTRYEAALLNACLDRITEVTDELRRLLKNSKPSWPSSRVALTASRPGGRTAATQFSTTTKLKGKSTFVLGVVKANSSVGCTQTITTPPLVAPASITTRSWLSTPVR